MGWIFLFIGLFILAYCQYDIDYVLPTFLCNVFSIKITYIELIPVYDFLDFFFD